MIQITNGGTKNAAKKGDDYAMKPEGETDYSLD
jgi:hypothetical protein